jgi:uncharacterized membrane protein
MKLPLAPKRFLLAAGLAAGTLLAILFPPFAQPDEPAHFFRAYALATGRATAVVGPQGVGAVLPESLPALAAEFTHGVAFHPEARVDPAAIRAAFARPLAPERQAFVDFRTASLVSPLPYLPQAAGIGLGLLLGAPPLALLYLGRLANLGAALCLVAWAVRVAPAYRWFLVLLTLSPMALSLFASLSADALTIATAWAVAAAVARFAFTERTASRSDLAALTVASAALCLTKLVYAPIAAAALLVPARRFPAGRRWRALSVSGGVIVAAFALSVALALRVNVANRPGATVDRGAQIEGAVAAPLGVAAVIARDVFVHAPRYAAEALGSRLGWLDTPLPLALLLVQAAVLLALLWTDGGAAPTVGAWPRLALVGLVASSTALVIASQYATWTPLGARFVEGVQGRYFLPLAFTLAWALHRRSPGQPCGWRRPGLWAAVWSIALVLATATAVAARFYS